jgi:hypothetical protein
MTAIALASLKRAAKWLVAIAVLVGAAAWALTRKRRRSVLHPDPVDLALQAYERRTQVAGAQYAVETAIARERKGAKRDHLLEILRDEDEDRRNDRLIETAERLKGD